MIRLTTALGIIGLAGLTILRGFSICQFSYANPGPQPLSVGTYRAWFTEPGVMTAALDAALEGAAAATGGEAIQHRADLLSELLALRPLSSRNWLALAGLRYATGSPEHEARAALAMSAIVGPNEGRVMWQRGIYGLLLWEALPPDERQRTIADLCGVIVAGEIDDAQRNQARAVVGAKPPTTQAEIKSLLIGEGAPTKALSKMGL